MAETQPTDRAYNTCKDCDQGRRWLKKLIWRQGRPYQGFGQIKKGGQRHYELISQHGRHAFWSRFSWSGKWDRKAVAWICKHTDNPTNTQGHNQDFSSYWVLSVWSPTLSWKSAFSRKIHTFCIITQDDCFRPQSSGSFWKEADQPPLDELN